MKYLAILFFLGLANALSNPCGRGDQPFFPHPESANKYIQCTQWGQMFVFSCPTGLEWNSELSGCNQPHKSHPFRQQQQQQQKKVCPVISVCAPQCLMRRASDQCEICEPACQAQAAFQSADSNRIKTLSSRFLSQQFDEQQMQKKPLETRTINNKKKEEESFDTEKLFEQLMKQQQMELQMDENENKKQSTTQVETITVQPMITLAPFVETTTQQQQQHQTSSDDDDEFAFFPVTNCDMIECGSRMICATRRSCPDCNPVCFPEDKKTAEFASQSTCDQVRCGPGFQCMAQDQSEKGLFCVESAFFEVEEEMEGMTLNTIPTTTTTTTTPMLTVTTTKMMMNFDESNLKSEQELKREELMMKLLEQDRLEKELKKMQEKQKFETDLRERNNERRQRLMEQQQQRKEQELERKQEQLEREREQEQLEQERKQEQLEREREQEQREREQEQREREQEQLEREQKQESLIMSREDLIRFINENNVPAAERANVFNLLMKQIQEDNANRKMTQFTTTITTTTTMRPTTRSNMFLRKKNNMFNRNDQILFNELDKENDNEFNDFEKTDRSRINPSKSSKPSLISSLDSLIMQHNLDTSLRSKIFDLIHAHDSDTRMRMMLPLRTTTMRTTTTTTTQVSMNRLEIAIEELLRENKVPFDQRDAVIDSLLSDYQALENADDVDYDADEPQFMTFGPNGAVSARKQVTSTRRPSFKSSDDSQQFRMKEDNRFSTSVSNNNEFRELDDFETTTRFRIPGNNRQQIPGQNNNINNNNRFSTSKFSTLPSSSSSSGRFSTSNKSTSTASVTMSPADLMAFEGASESEKIKIRGQIAARQQIIDMQRAQENAQREEQMRKLIEKTDGRVSADSFRSQQNEVTTQSPFNTQRFNTGQFTTTKSPFQSSRFNTQQQFRQQATTTQAPTQRFVNHPSQVKDPAMLIPSGISERDRQAFIAQIRLHEQQVNQQKALEQGSTSTSQQQQQQQVPQQQQQIQQFQPIQTTQATPQQFHPVTQTTPNRLVQQFFTQEQMEKLPFAQQQKLVRIQMPSQQQQGQSHEQAGIASQQALLQKQIATQKAFQAQHRLKEQQQLQQQKDNLVRVAGLSF